jgi:Tol biopolymer transport system component
MFKTRILLILFFLMPISANGITQVTDSGEGTDLMGSWSPDGSRIVYSTHGPYYDSNWYLMTVPSAGGAPEILYSMPFWNVRAPDWSPDGTKIVFTMTKTRLYYELIAGNLYTISATGSSSTLACLSSANALHPRWSPDGSKIAFCKVSPIGSQYAIYTIPAGGGSLELIASSEYGLEFYFPSWSPNGQKIVFQEGGVWYYDENRLWVVDVASKIKNPIYIPGVQHPRYPYWSRADNMIVFSAQTEGDESSADYDLWKVSEWGGTPIKINGYGTSALYPASSFDSSRIAYTNNDGDIFSMSVHETKVQPTSIGQIKAAYK